MRSKRTGILVSLYILVMVVITWFVASRYINDDPFNALQITACCASFILFCFFKPRGILSVILLFIAPFVICFGSTIVTLVFEYIHYNESRVSTGYIALLTMMSGIDTTCTLLLVNFYWSLPDGERRI